ncbi:asparaginase [Falsarthrobacter nasiphocae]|uniref:L-asparaginase II n=1 Tax=Falsarthrobacter nasiphocae TaxID=189863 RepID=A0AAE4C6M8_9MICC|nr:asparaginase [Falsarthrobacter nasiphocae]MDR6892327.1 L-asparaginase II [Falsarthrobacter nasiphocae]
MPETFRASEAVELAHYVRGDFIESRHVGSAVVLDPNGETLVQLGNVTAPVYARSTVKPFQAIAAMELHVPLRGPQVALAAASHCGSQEHQDVVRGMLAQAGLSPEDLRCPVDYPEDEATRDEAIRSGLGRTRLAFNCSGKHAAFLWACTENGWDTETYLDPSHPVQQRVARVIAEYTQETPSTWSVDGCGAPVPAVSLRGLATAFSTLAQSRLDLSKNARAMTVATAMLDYPWAVHGHGLPNTLVMEDLEVLAKLGAEGLLVLAAPDGTSVALKMLDGSSRATTLVGLSLLASVGAITHEQAGGVLSQVLRPIMGGDKPVGSLRLAEPVADLLA